MIDLVDEELIAAISLDVSCATFDPMIYSVLPDFELPTLDDVEDWFKRKWQWFSDEVEEKLRKAKAALEAAARAVAAAAEAAKKAAEEAKERLRRLLAALKDPFGFFSGAVAVPIGNPVAILIIILILLILLLLLREFMRWLIENPPLVPPVTPTSMGVCTCYLSITFNGVTVDPVHVRTQSPCVSNADCVILCSFFVGSGLIDEWVEAWATARVAADLDILGPYLESFSYSLEFSLCG